MKKIILSLMLAIFGVAMVGTPPAWAVYGDEGVKVPETEEEIGELPDCMKKTFLGMRPWFYGLKTINGCAISSENFKGEDNTKKSIIIIVLNVIHDIMMIVGILVTIFLMFGAYRYIRGGGDTSMVMKGKKTITYALIGLVVVLLAEVAVSTVGTIIQDSSAGTTDFGLLQIEADHLLQGAINFALGLLTIIAVGFAILSGILMITSWGDPGKLTTAKKGLATSVVGIIIAMVAFSITNLVMSSVQAGIDAGGNDLLQTAQQILGVIVGLCGFAAVCGIVVGGVMYMTSAGDVQKVTKGKNAVIWSAVGLGIAVSAGAIISFVLSKV